MGKFILQNKGDCRNLKEKILDGFDQFGTDFILIQISVLDRTCPIVRVHQVAKHYLSKDKTPNTAIF